MKCGAPAPISEARYPDPGNRRHCNLPFSACSHFYYNRSDERKIQKTPCFPISRREIGAPEGRLELPKGDWSPEGRLVSRREIGFPKGHLSMEYIYKYSVLGNRNRSDSLPCYCERPRPFRRLRLEAALRFSPACYCEITPRTPFVGV